MAVPKKKPHSGPLANELKPDPQDFKLLDKLLESEELTKRAEKIFGPTETKLPSPLPPVKSHSDNPLIPNPQDFANLDELLGSPTLAKQLKDLLEPPDKR